MKKLAILLIISTFAGIGFAKEKVTGKVGIGGSAVEQTESSPEFGGLYLLTDVSGGNDYVTAGGKIYYRLSISDDSNDLDKDESFSQKLDLKRAYIRIRPLASDILEFGIGKVYSYYLPGNYFSLSEFYTGSSRWGKTGLGVKYEDYGFTFGLALPVTESYIEFNNSWGLSGALAYNFKNLNEQVPLIISTSFIYDHQKTEAKGEETEISDDFSLTASLNFAKKFVESDFAFNTTLSYSYNAEPFVASSTFKNITNYNAKGLKKAHLISYNQSLDFSKVKITLEAEGGKSIENNWFPLYTALQTLVQITDLFSIRPRFYYYAAFNSQNSEENRQTFEIYPRIWFEGKKWLAYTGVDFAYKQTDVDVWKWEWNIPFFVEYKF
ncbi:MAG: hypothetical protein K5866_05670 [Treponema sp.]|nr:hypothetical protein [Treponema sp.]